MTSARVRVVYPIVYNPVVGLIFAPRAVCAWTLTERVDAGPDARDDWAEGPSPRVSYP